MEFITLYLFLMQPDIRIIIAAGPTAHSIDLLICAPVSCLRVVCIIVNTSVLRYRSLRKYYFCDMESEYEKFHFCKGVFDNDPSKLMILKFCKMFN